MIDRVRDAFDSHRWLYAVAGAVLLLMVGGSMRGGRLHGAGPFPDPIQTPLDSPLALAAPDGFEIEATDAYEVQALVLSRKRYRYDAGAELAPVDFLLGWGPVTLEPDVSAIKWSQSDRWGFWRFDEDSLSPSLGVIEDQCANTHIVPDFSSEWVRDAVLAVDRGDIVRLTGYLVKIRGRNGWKWNSSRKRTDRGDGSCEVVYVTNCEVLVP